MKGEFSENVGSDVDSHMIRQSLGVCVGITPFNFPAMVPMWMFPVAIVTEIVLFSNHQSVTLQPQYLLLNGLKRQDFQMVSLM